MQKEEKEMQKKKTFGSSDYRSGKHKLVSEF
jgi:hypothetical protein